MRIVNRACSPKDNVVGGWCSTVCGLDDQHDDRLSSGVTILSMLQVLGSPRAFCKDDRCDADPFGACLLFSGSAGPCRTALSGPCAHVPFVRARASLLRRAHHDTEQTHLVRPLHCFPIHRSSITRHSHAVPSYIQIQVCLVEQWHELPPLVLLALPRSPS
jgi:hypothetical protein